MSVIEDLEAGYAAIKQAVADAVAKLQSLAGALSSAQTSNDDAAVEAIAQELTATAAQLESAVNPAPASPAPAADPAPAAAQ